MTSRNFHEVLAGSPYEILYDYGLIYFKLYDSRPHNTFTASYQHSEAEITLVEYGARKLVEDLEWAKRIERQQKREEHLRSTNHALKKAWEQYQMVLALVK